MPLSDDAIAIAASNLAAAHASLQRIAATAECREDPQQVIEALLKHYRSIVVAEFSGHRMPPQENTI